MKSYNTDISPINLEDLEEEDKQRYLKLLKENKMKFTYDIEKDEYVALVQLEVKEDEKKKKNNYIKKDKKIIYKKHGDTHSDCLNVFLNNRNKKEEKKRKRINYLNPKNEAVLNEKKFNLVLKYENIFHQVNFSEMNSIPIIIPMKILYEKIEFFYNKFFDRILNIKNYKAIDLSKVIYNHYNKKYKDNYNFKRQRLAKWAYSLEKYKQNREIDFFRQILLKKIDLDLIIFYLFIREHFKFQTFNYFLNHFPNDKSPKDVHIGYKKGKEIITTTFYHNNFIQKYMLDLYENKFKKVKHIYYYDYLFFSLTKIDLQDVVKYEIFDYMISLYDFKDTPDIYSKPFEQNPHLTNYKMKTMEKMEEVNEKDFDIYDYSNSKRRKTTNMKPHILKDKYKIDNSSNKITRKYKMENSLKKNKSLKKKKVRKKKKVKKKTKKSFHLENTVSLAFVKEDEGSVISKSSIKSRKSRHSRNSVNSRNNSTRKKSSMKNNAFDVKKMNEIKKISSMKKDSNFKDEENTNPVSLQEIKRKSKIKNQNNLEEEKSKRKSKRKSERKSVRKSVRKNLEIQQENPISEKELINPFNDSNHPTKNHIKNNIENNSSEKTLSEKKIDRDARKSIKKYEEYRRKSKVPSNFLNMIKEEIEEYMEEFIKSNNVEADIKKIRILSQMFQDKILRLYLSLSKVNRDHFFSLLRIDKEKYDTFFSRMVGDCDYIFKRPDINVFRARQFFVILIQFQPLADEMVFMMENTLKVDEEIEKLLSLQDSIFLPITKNVNKKKKVSRGIFNENEFFVETEEDLKKKEDFEDGEDFDEDDFEDKANIDFRKDVVIDDKRFSIEQIL